MANKKITQLTAIAAMALEDLFAVVDDPSGTPVTKKATLAQVLALAEKTVNKGLANGYAALDADARLPIATLEETSAASRLLGRGSDNGAGDWEEISIALPLSMEDTELSLVASGESVLLGRGEGGGAGAFEHITLGPTLEMVGTVLDVVDSGGGGGAWELIEARTMTTNTQESFINLADYNELLLMPVGVTSSSNTILQVRVSTDNGANYLSSSGDYKAIAYDDPVGVNKTEIALHNASTTQAKNGLLTIMAFNLTTPKWAQIGPYVGSGGGAIGSWLIPTTTALNAIRVISSTGATLNGGTIYLFGRGA